ncbi:Riboflavin transporter RibU [compost metagenome]
MTVMAVLLNYFVLLPMYVNVFKVDLGGSIGSFIAVATVPFNILKGAISSTATVLLYKPVIAVINRQSIRTVKY